MSDIEETQDVVSTAAQNLFISAPAKSPSVPQLSRHRMSLLDLPPEIREKIYICIVRAERPILLNFSTGLNDIPTADPVGHSTFPFNLLLTNSQVYQEVRPLYFAHNTFSIFVRRRAGNEEWDYFLSPSFLDNRRQVQKLQITLFRWGSKNFFADVLGPALEDCILNGRLRSLEIRVNKSQIAGWMDGRNVMRSRNFHMMRKLLKDPYLEKAILWTGDFGSREYWDSDSHVEMMRLEDITSKLDELSIGEGIDFPYKGHKYLASK